MFHEYPSDGLNEPTASHLISERSEAWNTNDKILLDAMIIYTSMHWNLKQQRGWNIGINTEINT